MAITKLPKKDDDMLDMSSIEPGTQDITIDEEYIEVQTPAAVKSASGGPLKFLDSLVFIVGAIVVLFLAAGTLFGLDIQHNAP